MHYEGTVEYNSATHDRGVKGYVECARADYENYIHCDFTAATGCVGNSVDITLIFIFHASNAFYILA